ncbi:MAG: glycosyltransferase family 2 protein [Ginsengibacter sp.]
MKITGITIIRNAVINDYPIVEAISSILPIVDEMVVCIDKGEDDTEELIKSITSDKIRLFYTSWDMNLREGGKVLAIETDKAMQCVSDDTDWIFYIQGDEVIHEKYHENILKAARRYESDKKVEGLLFKYLHFYGTYDNVADSRKWYKYEVRVIRNDKRIKAYKDAQGFRKQNKKINVVLIDAWVYHYGWVKSPKQMSIKQKHVNRFWQSDDKKLADYLATPDNFDFNKIDSLETFTGTHPTVMHARIKKQNWHVELDAVRKNFSLKEKVLFWFEKKTGKRLFSFSNYRLLKP